MKKTERRQNLLQAARQICERDGLQALSVTAVGKKSGISQSAVSQHFTTRQQMTRALMRAAIENEWLIVIAQGVSCRDPDALKAPDELKKAALSHLLAV